jgi:hypothetical protein
MFHKVSDYVCRTKDHPSMRRFDAILDPNRAVPNADCANIIERVRGQSLGEIPDLRGLQSPER